MGKNLVQTTAVAAAACAAHLVRTKTDLLPAIVCAVDKLTQERELEPEMKSAYGEAVRTCGEFLERVRFDRANDLGFVTEVTIFAAQGLAFLKEGEPS
jgi:hypothetical protein